MSNEAFVTLATEDSSAIGCLVLGHSLRMHGTQRVLIVLITDKVSQKLRELLSFVFDFAEIVPKDESGIPVVQPEIRNTSAKLHCWRLTQYSKCVFLEADTLVVKNCDELFTWEELSAVPDVRWLDCFNSGVFVCVPCFDTYDELVDLYKRSGSFDGSDQGLLNAYFGRQWREDLSKRLPFFYNVVCSASYTYAPAYKQFGPRVKIIHFARDPKPWSVPLGGQSGDANQEQHFQIWRDIFVQKVKPHLSPKPRHPSPEQPNFMHHKDASSSQHFHHHQQSAALPSEPSVAFTPFNVGTGEFPRYVATRDDSERHHQEPVYSSGLERVELQPETVSHSIRSLIEEIPYSTVEDSFEETIHEQNEIPQLAEYEAAPSEIFKTAEVVNLEEKTEDRKKMWEEGRVDYLGADRFDNIWKRLATLINPDEQADPVSDEEIIPSSETSRSNTPDSKDELPGYKVGDYGAMRNWEQGLIEYEGRDSSDNIIRRLDFMIEKGVPTTEKLS